MNSAPWTEVGRLQQEMHSVQSDMHRKADSYEVDRLRGDVGGLERENQQLRSDIDALRHELYEVKETATRAMDLLESMPTINSGE